SASIASVMASQCATPPTSGTRPRISSAHARSLSAGWSPTPRFRASGRPARPARSAQVWPSSSSPAFGTRGAVAYEALDPGAPVRETTDRARPLEPGDADAVIALVHLRQPLEPSLEQRDLSRRGSLLGGEVLGRVDEARGDVAGHDDVDPAQLARTERAHRT